MASFRDKVIEASFRDEVIGVTGEDTERKRIRFFDSGIKRFHCEERDETTGLTLPAYVYGYDEEFSVEIWFYLGTFHNADRDTETGDPLPAVVYKKRGLITSQKWAIHDPDLPISEALGHTQGTGGEFYSPEDPEFLRRLAAWEEEHGVHGVPTVKSAGKH